MKVPSTAMVRALHWLQQHGDVGVLNRYGRVMAEGEVCGSDPTTWLRLFVYGYVERTQFHKVRVSKDGHDLLRAEQVVKLGES